MSESPADHSSNADNRDLLIVQILALLSDVTDKLAPDNGDMKQWMVENVHDASVIDLLQDTTLMMLRVLSAIGQLEPVNGINISKRFKIPKGTVSKTTRRLIAKRLINKEALPNNKKEVLFRLTPLGRELFLAHQAFDQQMERGFIRFLHRYNPTELDFMARVLQDFSETSFLDSDGE